MNHAESVILCRYVQAGCPHQTFDELTPDAWADLLGDLRFADCKDAAKTIVQRQPFCAPAEIRAEVKRLRSARITAVEHLFVPPKDCNDYGAWLAGQRRLAADGDWTEPGDFGLTHRDMALLDAAVPRAPEPTVAPAVVAEMRRNVIGKRPAGKPRHHKRLSGEWDELERKQRETSRQTARKKVDQTDEPLPREDDA